MLYLERQHHKLDSFRVFRVSWKHEVSIFILVFIIFELIQCCIPKLLSENLSINHGEECQDGSNPDMRPEVVARPEQRLPNTPTTVLRVHTNTHILQMLVGAQLRNDILGLNLVK
uniref:Uncharacterized protein n=1 Tax=Cacopsylla melanoneura TaxID=428564 RepID=A0A8D8LUL6_9HEMI